MFFPRSRSDRSLFFVFGNITTRQEKGRKKSWLKRKHAGVESFFLLFCFSIIQHTRGIRAIVRMRAQEKMPIGVHAVCVCKRKDTWRKSHTRCLSVTWSDERSWIGGGKGSHPADIFLQSMRTILPDKKGKGAVKWNFERKKKNTPDSIEGNDNKSRFLTLLVALFPSGRSVVSSFLLVFVSFSVSLSAGQQYAQVGGVPMRKKNKHRRELSKPTTQSNWETYWTMEKVDSNRYSLQGGERKMKKLVRDDVLLWKRVFFLFYYFFSFFLSLGEERGMGVWKEIWELVVPEPPRTVLVRPVTFPAYSVRDFLLYATQWAKRRMTCLFVHHVTSLWAIHTLPSLMPRSPSRQTKLAFFLN